MEDEVVSRLSVKLENIVRVVKAEKMVKMVKLVKIVDNHACILLSIKNTL
jgi:hypothetical protein